MKTATKFSEIKEHGLSKEIVKNDYLNAFANKMMRLSNDINNDDNICMSDIEEDYLPSIREFIVNITGL